MPHCSKVTLKKFDSLLSTTFSIPTASKFTEINIITTGTYNLEPRGRERLNKKLSISIDSQKDSS